MTNANEIINNKEWTCMTNDFIRSGINTSVLCYNEEQSVAKAVLNAWTLHEVVNEIIGIEEGIIDDEYERALSLAEQGEGNDDNESIFYALDLLYQMLRSLGFVMAEHMTNDEQKWAFIQALHKIKTDWEEAERAYDVFHSLEELTF